MDKFQVEPKLGHPDLAGGLSPLGNLCLWSCIIAAIPLIYLSGCLLVGDLNNFQSPYAEMPNYYTYQFLVLLIVLSILPIGFCFIWPLWKVHEKMDNWRKIKQERLPELELLIHKKESKLLRETEKLLDETGKSKPKMFEIIHKENILLESTKHLYERIKKLPTWPCNKEILVKLLITYLIPLLSMYSQLRSLFPGLFH